MFVLINNEVHNCGLKVNACNVLILILTMFYGTVCNQVNILEPVSRSMKCLFIIMLYNSPEQLLYFILYVKKAFLIYLIFHFYFQLKKLHLYLCTMFSTVRNAKLTYMCVANLRSYFNPTLLFQTKKPHCIM